MKPFLILVTVLLFSIAANSQPPYPVRGLFISATDSRNVDEFSKFNVTENT